MSGAMAEKTLSPPPHHFANNTLVSATEVIEEVSSATVRIFSSGTLLTNRMERTARREAMATPGMMARSGMLQYAAAGMIPMSADPARKLAAHCAGSV